MSGRQFASTEGCFEGDDSPKEASGGTSMRIIILPGDLQGMAHGDGFMLGF
jgi:hypothetical protein